MIEASKIIHETMVVGPLQCNCSLLACARTKQAVIIDPGDEGERIYQRVQELGLEIKYILHTHAHFDHIGGTGIIRSKTEAPCCLHRDDEVLYQQLPMQGQMFGMKFEAAPAIEKYLEDGDSLRFGDVEFEVIHTPGHSPGSVCFQVVAGTEKKLFSGDTLFQTSIGRTDLWGGNFAQIIQSIKDRILVLDDDLVVFPGHGPTTKVGIEKARNPFLNP